MRRGAALVVLAALALLPLRADALSVKPTVKQTLGSRHYSSTYGSVDVGSDDGDVHVKPSVGSYHSDDATGTYKTYGLRASYDTDLYTWAATAGFTPRVDGYANHFAGGEVTRIFDLEKASHHPVDLKTIEITGAITQTQHSDEFQGSVSKNGKFVLNRQSTTTLDIGQTDFEGTLAAEFTGARAELDVAKSVYNKDVARIGARSAQAAYLTGLTGVVQGFPDLNVNLRVDVLAVDGWTPWLSYTYTEYKVQQRPSAAYALGLDAEPVDRLKIGISYQRLAQAGQSDRNYSAAQVSYRFE